MKQKIKVEDLIELNACMAQVRKFKRKWPKGITISQANVEEAYNRGFDMEWLLEVVLEPSRFQAFNNEDMNRFWKWMRRETTYKEYIRWKSGFASHYLRHYWNPE